MYFEVNNFEIDYTVKEAPEQVWAKQAHLLPEEISEIRILREALDARKKNRIKRVYHFAVSLKSGKVPPGFRPLEEPEGIKEEGMLSSLERPIIIGMGPSGLFAALTLAEKGYEPLLLEQGRPVPERDQDVARFQTSGVMDVSSNVLFGEGGAGTYSDGKLTARNRSPYTGLFFERLIGFGAPECIAWQAKPHLGTDRLRQIVPAMTRDLAQKGVSLHFGTRVHSLRRKGTGGWEVLTNQGALFSDCVIIAAGHSADSLFLRLHEAGVRIEKKTFAIGLRIEHPRVFIDEAQYGSDADFSLTGAADYKLVHEVAPGRGVYSFCVCPGGEIINASCDPERVAVNGMSMSRRDGGFTNGAIVTTVMPADLPDHPLAGMKFREGIERSAAVKGRLSAPCQSASGFVGFSERQKPVSTYKPSCYEDDLNRIVPRVFADRIKEGLKKFDRQIRGFIEKGVVVGPETGTSSPIRILRNPETFESVSSPGLYPIGEGAGYAGGIVSSAVDGIRLGMKFIKK